MLREDFAPDVAAYPHRGEIRAGEDKRGHVADARVGHHPDVLEAVRLLDESDCFLDPPAREIALDDAPLRLECSVDGKRGQEHHRILSEAFDDDEMQLLLRVRREPHRHRAERHRHIAFLSVRIERDVVRMTHGALPGKVADLVHPSPRQDAAPFQPHDEVAAFPYEIVVEGGSVAPSVVHDHALAAIMDDAVSAAEGEDAEFASRVKLERLSVDNAMFIEYDALHELAAAKAQKKSLRILAEEGRFMVQFAAQDEKDFPYGTHA